MKEITWQDFEAVELRAGTVVAVDDFPEARRPAYKVTVDFGLEIGLRKTSARITELYTKEELMGRQIVGVVTFRPSRSARCARSFSSPAFTGRTARWSSPSRDARCPTAPSWAEI